MSESSERAKCGICWTQIGNKKVLTPCNHHYCTTCFFRWMKENRNCPACRKSFDDEEVRNRQELLHDINERMSVHFRILRRLQEDNDFLSRSSKQLVNQNNRVRKLVKSKKLELEYLEKECRITRQAIEASLNYRREWEELHSPR